jgi:hypothetical protein
MRAALLGLKGVGQMVADDEAVRAAGEAPVGDQRDVLAETGAHDGAGGGEHLRHAGPPFGTLVADHDHIALLDLAVLERMQHVLLGIEDARRPSKRSPSLPVILATAPSGARLPRRIWMWRLA